MIETTFTCTKANLMELHKVLYAKTAKRFQLLALVGVLLLIVGVVMLGKQEGDTPNGSLLVIFLGVFWTIYCLASANGHARRAVKRTIRFNETHYDAPVVTRIRFYTNLLKATNEATGKEKSVAMNEVARVVRTAHLIALILPDKTCLLADQRSVKEEIAENLWNRLCEQCSEAVIEDAS